MFPERGEAIDRTIEFEAALADLYADALNSWVTQARPLVVPNLAGVMVNGDPALLAASLPPNPEAVDETGQVWDDLSTEVILAGLSSLWALTVVEALSGLDLDLPELPESRPRADISSRVLRSITSTSSVAADDVREAVARIDADDALRAARDDYLTSQRESIRGAPTLMRDKVSAAVRDAGPKPGADSPTIEVTITRQRAAASAVLTPGSPEVRDVARYSGYQAAGVQNAAVITAARQSEDELEKVWIATIDGKTRPTHFAADGQRAPLGGTFTVGNVALAFPGDPDGPPEEVRNCRCRVGVLAADEEIPSDVDRHTERLDGRDSTARNRQGSQQDEIDRRAREGTVRARDDETGIGRTAAGGFTAPSEQEYDMTRKKHVIGGPTAAELNAFAVGDVDTEGNVTIAEGIIGDDGRLIVTDGAGALADGEGDSQTFRTFTDQPIAFIGIETSDGRMLADNIDLTVRTPPLPMMWTKQTGFGHEDAFTVGVIESARVDGDTIRGSGYMLNTDEADEAFNEAAHKVSRPSVDLAATEWKLTDEDGNEISEEDWWDLPIDAKVIQTITAAELIGTTLVATPAFGDTMLEFDAERQTRDVAVVASAAEAFKPRVYPASMFANPALSEPTLPTMDDTGRIFGHLACFGACHRSIQAQCVMAPRSRTNYSHFLTSPAVRLDNGTSLPVGRLTVGTGHAPDSLRGGPALAHYDNTGTCFALVNVGEDAHGIWFSGVAAPWATAEQVEMGLSSPLSGDWRDFGQGLELIAALAVNTPGFAVRGRDGADGRPAALVASLGPNPRTTEAGSEHLTADAIGEIVEAAINRAYAKREADAELTGLLAAADEKVGPPPPPAVPKTEAEELDELLARADSLS